MIKELRLTHWKSFSEATLYIDPLTFLIGPNASGKSNILDAFAFLNKIAWGRPIHYAVKGDAELSGLRGGVDWLVREGADKATLSVVVDGPEAHISYRYEISLRRRDGEVELCAEALYELQHKKEQSLYCTANEEEGVSMIPTYFYTGKQGKPRRGDMSKALCLLYQIKSVRAHERPSASMERIEQACTYVLEALQQVFILDPIPNHMRGYSPLSEELLPDASNIAGVLAAIPAQPLEAQLQTYLAHLPENDILRVWAEKVGRFGTDAMLYCQERRGAEMLEVDARSMSDGTLRFLAILVALLTRKEHSTIIIEEVDNGLHPSRAQLLVRMLKELGSQRHIDVLCTTHNPVLIDELGVEMLPFISFVKRDKERGDSQIELLEDLAHLPKLMAQSSFGELMVKGKI